MLQLENIRESMNDARSKDKDVQKRSVPDKSPTIKVDVRVREDIKNEASQKMIPVLLVLVLQKGPPLRDNPHFYDKSLLDDVANIRTVHKRALPFDRISFYSGLLKRRGQDFHIFIRDTTLEYFSSESIGDLRSADWIISHSLISDVRITKKSISANSKESEVRKDTWLDLFEEVCEDFKWQDGDMCWSIEAKSPERAPLKSIARARLDSPSIASFKTVASETLLSVPPRAQGRLDSPSTVSLKTVTSETQTVVEIPVPPPAPSKSDEEREDTKSAFSFSKWVKDVVTSAVASAVGVSKPT
ncbi:hypothetical protein F5146DRAFT_1119609 [Armillaria mellea]|nr:hypothetical protein F5146DRAFT_1119609 [Armillaria mellea]